MLALSRPKESVSASRLIAPLVKRPIDDWTIEEVSQFIRSADTRLADYANLFEQHVSAAHRFNCFFKHLLKSQRNFHTQIGNRWQSIEATRHGENDTLHESKAWPSTEDCGPSKTSQSSETYK